MVYQIKCCLRSKLCMCYFFHGSCPTFNLTFLIGHSNNNKNKPGSFSLINVSRSFPLLSPPGLSLGTLSSTAIFYLKEKTDAKHGWAAHIQYFPHLLGLKNRRARNTQALFIKKGANTRRQSTDMVWVGLSQHNKVTMPKRKLQLR